MKQVVSVSLGSVAGDFERDLILDGQAIRLVREGTNGDFERARTRIQELDGHVDALGLGGIDVYVYVGGERLVIGDGLKLAEAAKITPIVDGSGLKNTLERHVTYGLGKQGYLTPQTKVLLVSALDRFGMAEALVDIGCQCVFGDLIFNIGLDYALTTLKEVQDLAKKYRTRLLTVPFHQLYPTGESQDAGKTEPYITKYYEAADVIAGDAHLILRHLPERLTGKGIITNTTRPHTLARLVETGVSWIATTTPEMDGLSGATNLMEATLVALSGKKPSEITPEDHQEWFNRLGWHGSLHHYEGV